MRILQNHSEFIEYTPIEKEIRNAEEAEKKTVRYENIVVLFTAVEKEDNVSVAKKAIDEIKKSLEVIKCNKILIYPFVHLTNNPASAELALKVLKEMESYAKESDLETYRAPFGWNKQYNLKIKGHPLAEQSKVITSTVEKEEAENLKEEKVIKGFLVVLPNGEIKKFEDIDLEKNKTVKIIVDDETGKKEVKEGEPVHIKLARRLEIGEREPAADAGCLRFYPKGSFIKQLIRDLAWQKFIVEHGAYPIGTPIVFRKDDPGVAWLINHFPEKHYKVTGGKGEKNVELFLKTAGDYGSFSIFRDATMSHKSMPVALYEDELYDHRYEQRGEIRGMYRIRCFEMHNIHTACKNEEEAIEAWKKCFDIEIEIFNEMGVKPDAFIFFCLEKLFNKNHEKYLKELAIKHQRPVVIELLEEVTVYMNAWIDILLLDSLERPMELGTSQIDSFSSKNWNIKFKDEDNKDKYPLIIHAGFGSERAIAALLEYSSRKENPTFPLWMSPTQVRLCPINDSFISFSEDIMEELEKNNIRADIDDKVEKIEKKVRDAEMEWIPFIVVIGKKEKESGKLAVRIRETGKIENITLEELEERIKRQTSGYPFKPLSLPRLLTKRPKFV
jgi:threonyl-tRNA synthetase